MAKLKTVEVWENPMYSWRCPYCEHDNKVIEDVVHVDYVLTCEKCQKDAVVYLINECYKAEEVDKSSQA